MLWTVFRRPRQFALAVTLAIYGHHYRRICEHYIFEDHGGWFWVSPQTIRSMDYSDTEEVCDGVRK